MSETISNTFINKCILGEENPENIEDYVDMWHESESTLELHEYIGLTEDEYETWLRYPEKLPQIISNHKKGTTM